MGLAARHGGAAKLCGAGGGGYLVALVPPERHAGLAEALTRAGCDVRAARIAWRGLSVTGVIPDAEVRRSAPRLL